MTWGPPMDPPADDCPPPEHCERCDNAPCCCCDYCGAPTVWCTASYTSVCVRCEAHVDDRGLMSGCCRDALQEAS